MDFLSALGGDARVFVSGSDDGTVKVWTAGVCVGCDHVEVHSNISEGMERYDVAH